MATMTVTDCGCLSSAAAAASRSHASSPSFVSTSSAFFATAPAGNVTARVIRLGGRSRKTRGLLNGGRAEVRDAAVRALGRSDDNRDDGGAIKDMELYLDDLSLEYDSVWDTKPSWCQPWSIISSGVGAIIASWFLLHNTFLTGGATFVVSLWWFAFLYAYPLAYSDMIAERRKMVKDGSEDIYGRKRVE